MTVAQMLSQSGILTLLGMGVVFTFLIIMIICMSLLHVVIHALKWDKEPEVKAASAAPAPKTEDTGAIVAAIAAAIHERES